MSSPNLILNSDLIITKTTSLQDIFTLLLKNRHFKKSEIKDFITPPHPQTYKNSDYKINQRQFNIAFNRINRAIKDKENILIYGDYDVDGITATCILWKSLISVGAQVVPFIPDRETDGYGLKADSFFKFQQKTNKSFSLLVTVDNGIVAGKEIKKIIATGTDVVVTDHHLKDTKALNSTALIHSTLVSGCALAWILAKKFDQNANLGLVALGTVADCLPLIGINRSLVVHGLQQLRLNPNPGIKKLIQISGIKQDDLTASDLGFILGPRINAVGRLSNPTDALRLLCSQTPDQASKYAAVLDAYNKDRQSLQQESLLLAENAIKGNKNRLIFVSQNEFLPGIIGLLAGRLTEKYYLPSIIISQSEAISKGSCRSIKELNIIDVLRQCSSLLVDVGGHTTAAGFTIKTSNIPKFKKEITTIINLKLKTKKLTPSITVDTQMNLNAVSVKLANQLDKFAPFGIDNPEPSFLFKKIKIVSKRLLGSDGQHLKLQLDDPQTKTTENISTSAIAFKKGDLDSQLKVGDTIDVVAHLQSNTWNGTTTPQLVIKEILL